MKPHNPKSKPAPRRRKTSRGPLKKAPSAIVIAIALLVSIAWILEECTLTPPPQPPPHQSPKNT